MDDDGLVRGRSPESFEEAAPVRDALHVACDDGCLGVFGEVGEQAAGGDVHAVAVVGHLAEAEPPCVAPGDDFDRVVAALGDHRDASPVLGQVGAEGYAAGRVEDAHAVGAKDADARRLGPGFDFAFEPGGRLVAGFAEAAGEEVEEAHAA